MLTCLIKAIYARILAHWMHTHPRATWYLINTTLNYGAHPSCVRTNGGGHALRIRRHQTVVLIQRDNYGCAITTWEPHLPAPYSRHTTRFVDVITQTRAALRRQAMWDNDWNTIR